jgi:hypothetical protein
MCLLCDFQKHKYENIIINNLAFKKRRRKRREELIDDAKSLHRFFFSL